MTVEIGPFIAGEKPAPFEYQYLDSDGVAVNLTSWTQARFAYTRRRGGTPTNGAGDCTVTAAVTGKATYTWQDVDLETPGIYDAEMWVGNTVNRFASVRLVYAVRPADGPVPSI